MNGSFREVIVASSSSVAMIFSYFLKMTWMRKSGTNAKSEIILRPSSFIASDTLCFWFPD